MPANSAGRPLIAASGAQRTRPAPMTRRENSAPASPPAIPATGAASSVSRTLSVCRITPK